MRKKTEGAPRDAWSSKEGQDILARLADKQISVDTAWIEAKKLFKRNITRAAVTQAVSRYRRHGGRPPRHHEIVGSAVTARILEFVEEISEGAVRERIAQYEQQIADLTHEKEGLLHEIEMLRAQLEGRSRDAESLQARLTQRLERAGLVGTTKPD